jgi:hypothetical protein
MTITAFARLAQMQDDIIKWKATEGHPLPDEDSSSPNTNRTAKPAPSDERDDRDEDVADLRPSLN